MKKKKKLRKYVNFIGNITTFTWRTFTIKIMKLVVNNSEEEKKQETR